MRHLTIVLLSIVVVCLSAQTILAAEAPKEKPSVQNHLAAMPVAFTENKGQWPDSILFRASANGATMWFTKNGIWYQFFRNVDMSSASATAVDPAEMSFNVEPGSINHERGSIETTMIKAEFVGASESVEVVGLEELEYKCNYFIGNEPDKWRTDVPNYSAVTLRGLYPGVDVIFSTSEGKLQEELVVAASGDLAQIKVEFCGAIGSTASAENSSIVQTSFGELLFEGVLLSGGTASKSETQVVSASSASGVTLVFSTYIGGGSSDEGYGIAVDAGGNAYVVGSTLSANFPTQNPYQVSPDGSRDAFVTKLNSSGSGLVYSTYLAGFGDDGGTKVKVDVEGNAYVTGYTQSANFPTQNPFQASLNGATDAFVTKLNSTGSGLIYSTYLGGSGDEAINGASIAVDLGGSAYVTSLTSSTDFPTQNPFQATFGGGTYDAFVTKFNSAGNGLVYSTYFGGSNFDRSEGIEVDANGIVYLTGVTWSADLPTQNPFQATFGGGTTDAFITKLNSTGSGLTYSTYLGGSGDEYGDEIDLDAGGVYIAGRTNSTNFPTHNPFQASFAGGTSDAFVTKLSSTGSGLIYSTYLGGSNADYGIGIQIDAWGDAYVAGQTYSANFPTHNPFQVSNCGGADAFVTKLNSVGDGLIYSTFLGGNFDEYGSGVAVNTGGNAYLTGSTSSTNFPIQNPLQAFNGGAGLQDAFVTKLGGEGSVGCDPARVNLMTPEEGAVCSTAPTPGWSAAPCGTGYRLQYSAESNFPANSASTVTLELPFIPTHNLILPPKATRVYWRVFTRAGTLVGPPSEARYFDYQPSTGNAITSVWISYPTTLTELAYGASVRPQARLTSTYTGAVQGSWMLDGVAWEPIATSVTAGSNIVITAPSLPPLSPGSHLLGASIITPNIISAVPVAFSVLAPTYGLSDHIRLTASPNRLDADGASTSVITVEMLDANDNLVVNDNGWAGNVTLTLSGPGSLPGSAPFINGIASATYTAGTESVTADIFAFAWMQMGLSSRSVTVELNPPLETFLAEHDFLSNHLAHLRLDLFASPFDIPLANSYETDEADAFVNSRIRNVTPTQADRESFQRLLLAEKVLHFGYRHSPTLAPILQDNRPVAGAQELIDAGNKNLAQTILAGLGAYSLAKNFINAIGTTGLVKRLHLQNACDKILNYALAKSTTFLLGLSDVAIRRMPFLSAEERNLILALFATIKDVVDQELQTLSSESFNLTTVAISPAIRTVGNEAGLSIHVAATQDDLNRAVTWAEQNTSAASLAAATALVHDRIETIREIADERMEEVRSQEAASETQGALESMQAFLDEASLILIDFTVNLNVPSLSQIWGLIKDLWDVMKGILDIDRFIHAPQATVIAYSGAWEMRDHVEDGIAQAFGQPLPTPSGTQDRAVVTATIGVTGSELAMFRLHQLSSGAGRVAGSFTALQVAMEAADTSSIDSLLDQVDDAVRSWDEDVTVVLAAADAAYDTALAVVPDFEALLQTTRASVNRAYSYHIAGLLYGIGFALNPTATTEVGTGVALIDSAISFTETASEDLLVLRQSLFLVPAQPLLAILPRGATSACYGDTGSAQFVIVNLGGGTATQADLKVTSDPYLTLLGSDSISLAPLAAGDSVMMICSFLPQLPDTANLPWIASRVTVTANFGMGGTASSDAPVMTLAYLPGDVDGSRTRNVSDLTFLVAYLFRGGERPQPVDASDLTNTGEVNVADLTFLVNYLFKGGPAPAACL